MVVAKPQSEIADIAGLPERHKLRELLVGIWEYLGFAPSDAEQLIVERGERLAARAPFSVRIATYWSLAEQVEAPGLTHLDRVLSGQLDAPTGHGRVARDFEQALQQRRLFLIEQGWMGDQDKGPSRQALRKLVEGELHRHAKHLSGELGVPVLTYEARRVSGVYVRRIDLAQGRMALILGDRQASLVPWRPALERFAGREVEGTMRGQGLSWSLARGVTLGLTAS